MYEIRSKSKSIYTRIVDASVKLVKTMFEVDKMEFHAHLLLYIYSNQDGRDYNLKGIPRENKGVLYHRVM